MPSRAAGRLAVYYSRPSTRWLASNLKKVNAVGRLNRPIDGKDALRPTTGTANLAADNSITGPIRAIAVSAIAIAAIPAVAVAPISTVAVAPNAVATRNAIAVATCNAAVTEASV